MATYSGNGKSSAAAAQLTNTNSAYVEAVKSISRQAPELLDKIRSGQIKIPDASKLAKLPSKERRRVLKQLDGQSVSRSELHAVMKNVHRDTRKREAMAFAKKAKSSKNQNILIGSFDLLWDRLDNDSVDLFLTDPPYDNVDLYESLAELAAAKIKKGGLCLAYSGQFHLHRIMQAMSRHMEYWWTFAIEFSGAHCAIHPRHVQNSWKPILAFAKPPLQPAPEWLADHLTGGGRDKEYHDWGQDESEVEYLLNRLTQPDDLVVDAFCGGGSIPAACKCTGRRWLATEIDKSVALVARRRLVEMGKR